MKKTLITLFTGLSALLLLPGCLVLDFGGGHRSSTTSNTSTTNSDHHPAVSEEIVTPTLGQQLIDLQKAKDAGAITDAEYQAQKARLLQGK